MEIIQVTDYDVLADEKPGNRYDIGAYRKHIGNSRFSVLVDMYREAYDMSHIRGKDEECNKIIGRIVDVTCHKDVDVIVTKGRFLVKRINDDAWHSLEDEKQKELVRQALKAPTAPIMEEPIEAEAAVPFAGFSSMAHNDKKRGRRRSLLRRSASESTMMEDKKKTYKALDGYFPGEGNIPEMANFRIAPSSMMHSSIGEAPVLARQASAPVINTAVINGPIAKHEGMDVVVADTGRALSGHETVIGNNRLRVMLSLHEDRFRTLSIDDQEKVTTDLVKAVVQFYNGRVLIEQGFGYRRLTDDEAKLVFKALMIPEDMSIPVPQSSGACAKPLLSAPPVPDFLRNASIELMKTSGNGVTGPGNIQSAAIESLQRRKAKRVLTKGLGQGRSVPEFTVED